MKGDRRRAEREAKRSALVEQFGNPAIAQTSQPARLGRALFLRKRDMKQYVGAGGSVPEYTPPLSNDEKEKIKDKKEPKP